jgi:inosine-uridine nucleoside N-ribohydrolase
MVWLDTDTGNEMDDLYAIVRLLQDSTVQVVGISSAHFNNPDLLVFEKWNAYTSKGLNTVAESQRLNELLLHALQLNHLPHPLGADRQIGRAWGQTDPRPSPAAEAIIRTARTMVPGQRLQVLTLGALTNIATALLLAPDLKDKITIHALGARYNTRKKVWDKNEFNIRNDLNAFDYLLNLEGLDLVIMPLETAYPLQFQKAATLAQLNNAFPAEKILADRWLEHNPQDNLRIMWDLALVEAFLNPAHAKVIIARTPPENKQRKIKVYAHIDAPALEKDFWHTLAQHRH